MTDWLSQIGIGGETLIQVLTSLFVSILFIQSGLDKIFNYQTEKEFYQSHFKNSILRNTVPFLMPTITIAELLAGFLSALGVVFLLLSGSENIAIAGMVMASLSICMLFFGQRIAKDYQGSAVLVPYFLVTVAGLYLYLT